MKREANVFCNDLQCGDPKEKDKKWRENLRRVRSQNDMNQPVPQPPLFPVLDFDDEKFATSEAPREISWDEVITNQGIKETVLDNVIPETKNWEETTIITPTFLVIPETEIVEGTATFLDEVIPETESLEESALNTPTFLVTPETEIVEETATFLDEVISETHSLEESAIITPTFLVIPETEIVEETATFLDEVIPETERLEESAIITPTFLVIPDRNRGRNCRLP